MKRGEIRTVSGGVCAGKPRPAIIIQDDACDRVDSLTLPPRTTNAAEAPLIRPDPQPNPGNGPRTACRAMIDRIAAVPRASLGARVDTLAAEEMLRINRALVLFLGIG